MLALPLALSLSFLVPPVPSGAPAQDARKLERAALGKDDKASRDAIRQLGELGADGVPALTRLVERGPEAPRTGALFELTKLRATALPALPALEELCGAPHEAEGGGFASAVALLRWHAVRAVVVHELFGRFEDEVKRTSFEPVGLDWFEPYVARVAWGTIAVHDIAAQLERLAGDRKRARSIANGYDDLIVALGAGVVGTDEPPLDALQPLLAHADPTVRQAAALVLSAAGAKAGGASEEVAKLVSDADRDVAARAIEALAALGLPAARARELLEPLRTERGVVGPHATRTLALLCQDDETLRAGLLDLAEGRDVVERRLAAAGLGRLAVPNAKELEALGELLADRDQVVRVTAISSVRDLGPSARSLTKVIERRIASEKIEEILRLLELTQSALERE